MSEIQAENIPEEDVELSPEEDQQETVSDQSEETTDSQEDEVVISIGEDSPPSEEVEQAQAPAWVKELRKNHRELQKRNRELEEKLKATQPVQESQIVVGNKPTLDDVDYDSEKYEEELSKWFERKRLADEQTAKIKEQRANEDKAWNEKLNSYKKAKSELRVSDFEEAEWALQEILSTEQQGILLHGSEHPEKVVYALGKNTAKAKELAAIKDPVKYAFAVAKLETQLKITKRNAPLPESQVVKGSAALSGSDSTLNRLYSEAEKTGDYSKVVAYKKAKSGGGKS